MRRQLDELNEDFLSTTVCYFGCIRPYLQTMLLSEKYRFVFFLSSTEALIRYFSTIMCVVLLYCTVEEV
jgi:hypothetical protein